MLVSDSPMDIYAKGNFRFLAIITSTFPTSSHWLYLPKTARPPKTTCAKTKQPYISHTPHPSTTMPPISKYLRWIHYFAFCRQHRINPLPDAYTMDSIDASLLKAFRHLRDYKPVNDIGVRREQAQWINFAGAVQRCETQGFNEKTVEKLLQTVRELGGEKVAWKANFTMDSSGNLLGEMVG